MIMNESRVPSMGLELCTRLCACTRGFRAKNATVVPEKSVY